MSKTRQKERSEIELLKGRIRKLESENRAYRRENKSLKKKAHFHETTVEELAELRSIEEHEETQSCPQCGKGKVSSLDFVHLILETCDSCDYRKRTKKGD